MAATTFDPFLTPEFTTAADLDIASCLTLRVPVEQDTFDIDDLAAGIAFLVGLIVGALLALLCARLCYRDTTKEGMTVDDAEGGYMNDNMVAHHDKNSLIQDDPATPKKKGKKGKRGLSAKNSQLEEEDPLLVILPLSVSAATEGVHDEKLVDGDHVKSQDRGLVHVLEQGGIGAGDEEVAAQDMDAVSQLERELKEESIMSMIQVLRTLLGQQLKKGKVTKVDAQDLLNELQSNIQTAMQKLQEEKDEKEKELRKKIKDPSQLQEELDKNHSVYMIKLNSMIKEEKENTRKQLGKKTDLSDADIQALLSQFDNNMAHMEHNLGLERARQAANLEERLQRRRLHAAMADHDRDLEQEGIVRRQGNTERLLTDLTDARKLTDKQRDALLAQHSEDLERIQKKSMDEQEIQRRHLAEKLKKAREERQQALAEKQAADRETFINKRDMSTDSGDLLEHYHQFQQQQRDEREELSNDLDDDEAEQFKRQNKEISVKRMEELEEKEESLHEKLRQLSPALSDVDFERMIEIHHQEMDEWERMKKDEKKRMKAKLAERMAQRQAKLQAEELQTVAEQESIRAEQDLVVNKLIESQIQLSDDAKEKLLREHDQNMTSLNNHLNMSKMKQNKALEAKLAKRKAKVEELKKKQEELKHSKKEMKQKEREKQEQQLAAEIEATERSIEDERNKAASALRERLAAETAEALAEQEQSLGEMLARLEVGQARRQAIIAKQDKTIKNLEEQIVQKVNDSADPDTSAQVDYLLKGHYSQVNQLEEQLQDVKERQQMQLQEKLQAKRMRKEREVESRLEEEAATEWQSAKQRGAGLATSILSQAMLEQRHKKAIDQLEKEMSSEMQRQMDDLHSELQQELQQELDEQKKSFLAQVAAISQLSKAEVNELVEDAVAETGGSDKQAKKLAKEMRLEMQRAKTSMGNDDREDPYSSMKRTGTGYGFENQGYQEDRPKSSKKRPKSAFRE